MVRLTPKGVRNERKRAIPRLRDRFDSDDPDVIVTRGHLVFSIFLETSQLTISFHLRLWSSSIVF